MSKIAKASIRVKTHSLSDNQTLEPVVSKETLRYREMIPQVEKRDGRLVPFDFDKISTAIRKAMTAAEEGNADDAILVAHQVAGELGRFAKKFKGFLPTVEGSQDLVEKYLILNDYVKTAKAYILYRAERAKQRAMDALVPTDIKEKIRESSKYFATPYQEFIFYQFYSRWSDALGRRETWVEAIDRFMDFMRERLGTKLTQKEYNEVREGILTRDV